MRLATGTALAALLSFIAAPPSPGARTSAPLVETGDLATGPYSSMHALLEKTLFNVDVLRVDVRFGEETRERLEEIARSAPSPGAARDDLALAASRAENAVVRMRFERDVSLDQFLDGVRDDLGHALRARMITEQNYRHTSAGLAQWFGFLEERGFRKGDRLVYRVRPESLRTMLISADGRVLLDQTDEGTAPRLALLSGQLAPGASLRDKLVRSLGS